MNYKKDSRKNYNLSFEIKSYEIYSVKLFFMLQKLYDYMQNVNKPKVKERTKKEWKNSATLKNSSIVVNITDMI